jgi:DNA invertase Pin-like site-specific DNA recombinase
MNCRRIALYARCSTKNNGQDPETQLIALREFATARGFLIAGEYIDIGVSGAKDRRPELDRLMTDARRRKIDAVLVARFDRFARSTKHLVLALEEFSSLGIDFISLNESIDTSTPMGRMVFTIVAAVAELERSIIKERVVMGLARAKGQGKKLGRPQKFVSETKIHQLAADGLSLREIGDRMGVSHTKVARLLRSASV